MARLTLVNGLKPHFTAAFSANAALFRVTTVASFAVAQLPFPLGLARVSDNAPALVPWAWGVNGCASVISAVLAATLAVNLGFTFVVAVAAATYVASAVLLHAPLREPAVVVM